VKLVVTIAQQTELALRIRECSFPFVRAENF